VPHSCHTPLETLLANSQLQDYALCIRVHYVAFHVYYISNLSTLKTILIIIDNF
jgi:hypothetical protein